MRILGIDHPTTIIARDALAQGYEIAGQFDDAIALHERALADAQRVFGLDHPDTIVLRNDLASSYQHTGRLDEAIALLKAISKTHNETWTKMTHTSWSTETTSPPPTFVPDASKRLALCMNKPSPSVNGR